MVCDGSVAKFATNSQFRHKCLRRNDNPSPKLRRKYISLQIFATEMCFRRKSCDEKTCRRKVLRGKIFRSQLLATNCNVVANFVAKKFFCNEKSFVAIFCDEFVAKKSNIRSPSFCDEFVAIFASKLFRRKKFVAKRSFSCSD